MHIHSCFKKITADLVSNKTYVQHFPISQISCHLDLRQNYKNYRKQQYASMKGVPKTWRKVRFISKLQHL